MLIGITGARGAANAAATAAQQKHKGEPGPAGPRQTEHTPGPGGSTAVQGTRDLGRAAIAPVSGASTLTGRGALFMWQNGPGHPVGGPAPLA
ncbi:MAG TPA: hypothetical protein VMU76_13365 [Acidimicrobiales bacterium]|nr:hypothetical protein [Acidimicrobiales bacterium]